MEGSGWIGVAFHHFGWPETPGHCGEKRVLGRGGRIRAWFGGIYPHAHSVEHASPFLGFGGLRVALHQCPQFSDSRVLLTHLYQRLAFSKFSRRRLGIAGVLFQNGIVTLDRGRVFALAIVDLTNVKLGISRQGVLRVVADDITELRKGDVVLGGVVIAKSALVKLIDGRRLRTRHCRCGCLSTRSLR